MSRPVSGYGSFTFPNGKYTGEWASSEAHGWGRMEFTDGNVYDGNFSNGKKEGTGVFRWANGNSYVGRYNNDLREGKGVVTLADGYSYDGDWKNGLKDGKGVCTWADGCSYDGDWKNGLKEGKGVFTWADGNSYDGEWKNDLQNGKGVMKYAVDGKTSTPGLSTSWNARDVCDCEWKDGTRRHGACRYTFFNGEVYACTFVDGVCSEFDARQAAVRAAPDAASAQAMFYISSDSEADVEMPVSEAKSSLGNVDESALPSDVQVALSAAQDTAIRVQIMLDIIPSVLSPRAERDTSAVAKTEAQAAAKAEAIATARAKAPRTVELLLRLDMQDHIPSFMSARLAPCFPCRVEPPTRLLSYSDARFTRKAKVTDAILAHLTDQQLKELGLDVRELVSFKMNVEASALQPLTLAAGGSSGGSSSGIAVLTSAMSSLSASAPLRNHLPSSNHTQSSSPPSLYNQVTRCRRCHAAPLLHFTHRARSHDVERIQGDEPRRSTGARAASLESNTVEQTARTQPHCCRCSS
jgi:hypothetical protein